MGPARSPSAPAVGAGRFEPAKRPRPRYIGGPMIMVHEHDSTLRFIRQRDHAEGAGQLAAQWQRPEALPAPIWRRFVEAVRRHDDGWLELEQRPAVDAVGRPHTFKTLPTEQHVAIWRHGVEQLSREDSYAGLVLALHARWLYTHIPRNEDRTGEAIAQDFVYWVEERLDTLVRSLEQGDRDEREAVVSEKLDIARRLIGFFDMLSLILLGGLELNDWPEPLPFGNRWESFRLHQRVEHGVGLAPWPFQEQPVRMAIDTYELEREQFASAEAFGRALTETAPTRLTYTVDLPEPA